MWKYKDENNILPKKYLYHSNIFHLSIPRAQKQIEKTFAIVHNNHWVGLRIFVIDFRGINDKKF